MKNTVNPELLDASTQDISQTWEAIQDQVAIKICYLRNLLVFTKLCVYSNNYMHDAYNHDE